MLCGVEKANLLITRTTWSAIIAIKNFRDNLISGSIRTSMTLPLHFRLVSLHRSFLWFAQIFLCSFEIDKRRKKRRACWFIAFDSTKFTWSCRNSPKVYGKPNEPKPEPEKKNTKRKHFEKKHAIVQKSIKKERQSVLIFSSSNNVRFP